VPLTDPVRKPERDDRERARKLYDQAGRAAVGKRHRQGRERIHIPPTVYSTINASMAYCVRTAERVER
jgi:hypothetical protein